MHELRLQQFSGPIEKLLELIEEKKLEITEFNLAEITASFLDYLKKLAEDRDNDSLDSRLIADFVVVASRLLLIKSKALLPSLELTGEEEAEIKDLEERLLKYREFKPAMLLFKKLYEGGKFSVSRPFFCDRQPIFYPPKNIGAESLHQSISELFKYFNESALETKKIDSPLVKLEEKIEEIIKYIEKGAGRFSKIAGQKSRPEIIVLFLALLHLLRDQIIKTEQNKEFDDIIIHKI